jgi:hypothetical protein
MLRPNFRLGRAADLVCVAKSESVPDMRRMTYGHTRYDFTRHHHRHSTGRAIARGILAGAVFACVTLAGAWALYVNSAAPDGEADAAVAAAPDAPVSVVAKATGEPGRLIAPSVYAALIDSNHSLGLPPAGLSRSAPREASLQPPAAAPPPPASIAPVEVVAPPPARPARVQPPPSRGPSVPPMAARSKVLTATKADKAAIFEKLFGKPREAGPELAYASADGGIFGDPSITSIRSTAYGPPYGPLTAVYDISAHTVYMPDGTTLEAHSGLGPKRDDPRHVHIRMQGATPPHVYDLKLRESLFHGVQALRLLPVGGNENIFRRDGILAHTYMLGPNGDSNGCVSFKNYDAFLRAFRNDEIKQLVVVASVE